MSFITDKQTLEDLNITGKYRPQSIFGLFNKVRTGGGERLLEKMFQQPMTNAAEINKRSNIFRFFHGRDIKLSFDGKSFRLVEDYLSMGTAGNFPKAIFVSLKKKFQSSFLHGRQFEDVKDGLMLTIEMLRSLKQLTTRIQQYDDHPLQSQVNQLTGVLNDHRIKQLCEEENAELSLIKLVRHDYLLRNTLRDDIEGLLNVVYELDVFIAVSQVAAERHLFYAEAVPATENIFNASAVWHPAVEKAVANQLYLSREKNVMFLTGANMAGKSTFMKSFAIAVYLAHMGFPVAAKDLRFSVRDGLFTSINVPDNLSLGYSHFYAEVKRVRHVAEQVSARKNLVVIFDELFKGTNVKDAFDATLAVTESFAAYRNSCFIISTHIIEVGETLGERCDNVQFWYMPTIMEGAIPRYPYIMRNGITSDRHGMKIIENENILEIIRS